MVQSGWMDAMCARVVKAEPRVPRSRATALLRTLMQDVVPSVLTLLSVIIRQYLVYNTPVVRDGFISARSASAW